MERRDVDIAMNGGHDDIEVPLNEGAAPTTASRAPIQYEAYLGKARSRASYKRAFIIPKSSFPTPCQKKITTRR